MRIPGPGDLLRLTSTGYEALERAIALVPRLVAVLADVELILQRVQVVVAGIEDTQRRAGATVERVDRIQSRVTAVVERTSAVVDRTEVVVVRAAQLTGRLDPLLDRFYPTLDRLEPMLARLAATTSPAEIDAVVKLVDALPTVVDKLDADILPVLDTLSTVAPDLRDLLDASRELNELISSVPGLGRVRRKIDEEQDRQDAYRAEEEPPAAPDRRDASAALVGEGHPLAPNGSPGSADPGGAAEFGLTIPPRTGPH